MIKIEQYLDGLMHDMIDKGISDAHFDLGPKAQLLLRRHKVNIEVIEEEVLIQCYEYLRFKAGFDLSKGKHPQTGSFTYRIHDKNYYLRFAALETPLRKHGVLRVLNMNHIDTLSASVTCKRTYNFITKQLQSSNGIILFSGMTGSGKTTTLFNALKTLEHRQIFTLENPIESIHDFCIQLELNPHQDLTFESGLNQLLRHDPDVIVLGEIRSEEDLKQCVRAGLSGHLVLSTIHSSSLQASLHRLLDLGLSHYDLTSCIRAIIYQEMEVIDHGVSVKYQTASPSKIQKLLQEIQT